MPRLSMIPSFPREMACPRSFPREQEPALVMDGAAKVAAYTHRLWWQLICSTRLASARSSRVAGTSSI